MSVGTMKAASKDPELYSKILELAKSGHSAEEIGKIVVEDEAQKKQQELEAASGEFTEEPIPDEIQVMAQALAYRHATVEDTEDITSLLNDSHRPDVFSKNEAFRTGDLVQLEVIRSMIEDTETYSWILVEAPDGRGVEKDGIILGVSCFSMNGTSRRNGEVEGKLGSIRFLGVLRRFHGVLIGSRLLRRVEEKMHQSGCCRVMACLASSRVSLGRWLQSRGYVCGGGSTYPASSLGHEVTLPDLQLLRYLKPLDAETIGKNAEWGTCNKTGSKIVIVGSTPVDESADSPSPLADNPNPTQPHAGEEPDLDAKRRAAYERAALKTDANKHLPPLWRVMSANTSVEDLELLLGHNL